MKSKLERSLALQQKSKRLIPGMTQLLSKRPDMFSLGVWPGYFSRAKGVNVWDLDDNCYIDMSIGGIGANSMGYADPDVDAAVLEAIANGTSCSLNCPEEVYLAELLCELHPWADMVRYARTGGEAMAVAVRIARAHTNRDKVAFCGYHGWHDWYLAATLKNGEALDSHLLPGLDPRGVPKALAGTALPFHYNDVAELEVIFSGNKGEIAAVILEPIRNNPPEPSFMAAVRSLARENGAVIVYDEISSGFRLNTGGAHLIVTDVEPDMAVFSKGMSNGYPMAAILGRARVMEAAQSTFISSTYWTDRVGPVAALATLRKHRRVDAGKHLCAMGQAVQRGWREIADRHGLDVSIGGIFPLSHFGFEHPRALDLKAYFVQLMLERGFLASTQFYSMYAHQHEHVDEYLRAADEAFGLLRTGLDEDTLGAALEGAPARQGFARLN